MSFDIFFADPDEAMRFVTKHTNPSIDYDPLYFTANPDDDCDTPSKPPKLMRSLSLSSANPSREDLVPLVSVRSFRLDITNEFTTMPDLTTGEAMSLPRENGTKDLMLFAARHTFASRVGDVLGRMTALECLRLCLPFSAHRDYYRLVPNILQCAPQSLRSLETDARYCRGRSDVFEGTNFQNLEGLVLEGVQDLGRYQILAPCMPALRHLTLKTPEERPAGRGNMDSIAKEWMKACDELRTVVVQFGDGTRWTGRRNELCV